MSIMAKTSTQPIMYSSHENDAHNRVRQIKALTLRFSEIISHKSN